MPSQHTSIDAVVDLVSTQETGMLRAAHDQSERSDAQSTFLRLVEHQVSKKRDHQFCSWLDEKLEEVDSRTFGEVWRRAGAVAAMLAGDGVVPGDRVLLCFNFGLDFLDAFLGCLRLGAIAVPVYPPNPAKLTDGLKKLANVVADCGAQVGLMDKSVNRLRAATRGWPSSLVFRVPKVDESSSIAAVRQLTLDARRDDEVAFLQYTSGSTGDPKGVMLTFANISANCDLSTRFGGASAEGDAVGFSWLPQFHDMGLLFCTLYPLARGTRQFFMSPTVFIQRPVAWIEGMSKYACTWTIAPNFSYGLSARKFSELPADKRPQLDLSPLRAFGNGAEPVQIKTMLEFVECFAPFGLLTHADFFTCYGLAEHTVGATTVALTLADDPTLSSLCDARGQGVCCGLCNTGPALLDLRIVDAQGQELPAGEVGEIWLRSASCGVGYWGRAALSAETFGARLHAPRSPIRELEGVDTRSPPEFLRTGDQGFIEEGEHGAQRLFVCGREKDVIIIRGRNLYPQDLELVAEEAAQGLLRLNCSAAFQSHEGGEGGRELDSADLVCEVKHAGMRESAMAALCDRMAAAVRGSCSVRLRRLLLLRPRQIPKTTSGKIRRRETARQQRSGELLSKALMVWEDESVMAATSGEDGGEDGGSDAAAAEDGSLESFVRVTTEEVCLATGLEAGSEDLEDSSIAAMGLDSMSAATLAYNLRARLRVEVRPEDLICARSVLELAQGLHDRLHETQTPPGAHELAPVDGQNSPAALSCEPEPARRGGGWASSGGSGTAGSSGGKLSGRLRGRLDQVRAEGALQGPDPAGAAALAARVGVQVVLVCWVLLSLYLCAIPAVLVAERVTDIQIFPLLLFRWLVEPRLSAPAVFEDWGARNLVAVSDMPAPGRPPIKSVWLAVPLGLIGAAATFMLALSAYVVLLKWVVLGRVQPGDYPLWGWLYWRRWLVQRHVELLLLVVSPVLQDAAPLSLLYSLLGARIGWRSDAKFSALGDVDWDLVTVEPRAAVSGSASLLTAVVSGKTLHLRRVLVGEGSDVQDNAVLCPGVVLPPRTLVQPQTVVLPDTAAALSAGATLAGTPAAPLQAEPRADGEAGASVFGMVVVPTAWLLCMLLQGAVCVLPIIALHEFGLRGLELSGLAMVCVAVADFALYLLSLCLFTVASKWLLLGRRLRVGAVVRRHSALAVARECVLRLQGLVQRFVLHHCWGGECINMWYRAMGASLGRGTILSLAVSLSDWDAVHIGEDVLLGGGCTLQTSAAGAEGDTVVQGIKLADAVTVGSNTWVGAGCELGERVLVTSLSRVRAGESVPAHAVVNGEEVRANAKRCYLTKQALPWSPPLVKEVWVWVVHVGWTILAVWCALYAVWWLRVAAHLPALLLFPLGGGLYQLMQLALVVLHKWAVARERSTHASGEESEVELLGWGRLARLYSQMYLQMAFDASLLGQCLKAGPLLNLYLRSLRARVHLDAYLGSAWCYDFEQLEVDAGAAVNLGVALCPHVVCACASVRLQPISIGRAATVWPRANLVGRSALPDRTHLAPLSRMAPASTALAVEELERQAALGEAAEAHMLVGVPALQLVAGGLAGASRAAAAHRGEPRPEALSGACGCRWAASHAAGGGVPV